MKHIMRGDALRTTLYLLLFIVMNSYSNVGGMFHYPGVIADPVANEKTDFSVEKEILDITFYKQGPEMKCRFTAKYILKRDSSIQSYVAGTFYGIRNDNVKIFGNSNRIDTVFSDSDQSYYDNNFLNDRSHKSWDQGWYDDEVSKKNFIYYYDSTGTNVLTVQGEALLKYSKTWGFGAVIPSIRTRHPFLNRNAGNFVAYFKYIIDPIHSWKTVGSIDITVNYPEDYRISINAGSKLYISDTDAYKSKIIKTGKTDRYTFRLEKKEIYTYNKLGKIDTIENYPRFIDIDIEKQQQTLYPGGLKLGFGSRRNDVGLTMRYGWECAFEKKYIDTHLSLDYETNYRNYDVFSLSVFAMSPWFGFPFWIPNIGIGPGIVYNLDYHQPGIRILHESNFAFVGFCGSYDYYPTEHEWVITLLGQLTF